MNLFKGTATAIVTPFSGENVDFDKLGELIDWQIEEKINALVIAGTTGESATLSMNEHMKLMHFCVEKINDRVPTIIGTGSNNTKHSLELSLYAEECHADALLIVTPYYNKTTQLGIVKHYEYIADRVNTPIIMYNVPSRTGFNMSVDAIVELSKHKNIAAIKEASGNLAFVANILSRVPEDFYVYSGVDEIVVPMMSIGAKGVISVVSNVLPRKTSEMTHEFLYGSKEKAGKIQLEMMDIINSLFIETNPIPVKTCLNLMGKNVGDVRLPLCEMSNKNIEVLKKSMKNIGLECS